MSEWPKSAIIFLHASKDKNYELGEKLGLKKGALSLFSFAFSEVGFVIEVNEDGTYSEKGRLMI